VDGQLNVLVILNTGKEPPVPNGQKAGGSQSEFGHSGKEKKPLPCPCQELNPSNTAHSLVTTLTKIQPSKFHYLKNTR